MNGFWDSCLTHFEKQLSAQQFNTWIKPLRLENAAIAGGELRLIAPNRFVMQWVRERFLAEIEEISRKFFSSPVVIALALSEPRGEFRESVQAQAAIADPAPAPQAALRSTHASAPANPRPAQAPAYEKTR